MSRVWLCTLSVCSPENVRLSSLSLSHSLFHRFLNTICIFVYVYTYDNDAKRLDCDPTGTPFLPSCLLPLLTFFFFFAPCLAPPPLRLPSIHTQNTHRISMLFTGIYNGVQLMRVNDRARRQMRRQGDFARTLTSGRYRKRGLATENRPTGRPGVGFVIGLIAVALRIITSIMWKAPQEHSRKSPSREKQCASKRSRLIYVHDW